MWVGRTAMAMAAVWVEAIGLLAGVIGIFAWIPQIRQVWVHKRHDGISLTTFAVVFFALSLWLVYGILVDSFAMIAANIMTLSVIGAVIFGVLRVRKNELRSEEDQL
jgi:MtN3 and saliva related transmembrane protein